MQHLEVSGAVRPLDWSLGIRGLSFFCKGLKAEIVSKVQAKMVTSLVKYRKYTGQCV